MGAKTPVILLGPKHSGKTSVGKVLAVFSGAVFIDLDDLVTGLTGKSPRLLYTEGAEIFKAAETEAVRHALENPPEGQPCIIAAGGGIIDNENAVTTLKNAEAKNGVLIVYLNVHAQTAWARIKSEGELPPFLRTENPRKTHAELHERRAAAYKKIARNIIDCEKKTPEEIAREIISLFS